MCIFGYIIVNLSLCLINPFQPSDDIWRHTSHLSSICMSFAQ
jgi:hypothetical protein